MSRIFIFYNNNNGGKVKKKFQYKNRGVIYFFYPINFLVFLNAFEFFL